MKCKDIQYRLPDLLRHKVTEDEYKSFAAHIDSCKQCHDEYESIKIMISEIDKDKLWQPSNTYWNTLLTRIHYRIESKPKSPVYERFIQYAIPAAAAVILIVITLQLIPLRNGMNRLSMQNQIAQLPSEELQDYLHQQSIFGVDESVISTDNISYSDVDKIIMKEILDEGHSVSTYLNNNDEILYETITDQTADKVVSIIENNIQPSID